MERELGKVLETRIPATLCRRGSNAGLVGDRELWTTGHQVWALRGVREGVWERRGEGKWNIFISK